MNLSKNDLKIEEKVESIELMILKQQAIFKTDPLYITNFTKFYMQSYDENIADPNIFDHVFISGITTKLKTVNDSKFIKIAVTLLKKLAYFVFSNKKYPFSFDDYHMVASEYSKKIETIDECDYLNKLVKSRIIKQINEDAFRFENKYYLSYFIALELQYRINNKGEHNIINYLLDNICMGINSDILLYYSLINGYEKLEYDIIDKAEENSKNIEPFDFKKKKYDFLYRKSDKSILTAPTKNEAKDYESKTSETEEDESSTEILEVNNYFDYNDVTNVTNEIVFYRSIKYEEILGKILTNFYQDLEKPTKQRLLHILFNIPNQILTLFFDNFQKSIDEFRQLLLDISKDVPFLRNHINDTISFLMLGQISYTYELMSSWYSVEDMRSNIVGYKPATENEKIQQIICYGKFDDMQKFYESAANYIKNNNDFAIGTVLKMSVRNIMLFRNKTIDNTNRQWMATIFPKEREKIEINSEIKKNEQ